MPDIKSALSKAFWPIFTFYFVCLVIGIGDMIFSPNYVVLNSFDFMINNYYYYFLPFSILISYLVLDVLYKHPEYVKLAIGFKILIHLFSIMFISWGIVGSISIVNKIPSKSQAYVLTGKIIEIYKKEPHSGYKRTYDKTRFFVTIQQSGSRKEYNIQIKENIYDSLNSNYKSAKFIIDSALNKVKVDSINEVSIYLKKGWLGIIY